MATPKDIRVMARCYDLLSALPASQRRAAIDWLAAKIDADLQQPAVPWDWAPPIQHYKYGPYSFTTDPAPTITT